MKVAVVIVSYNAAERIRACLRSVLAQTYDQSRYDVIVVDNASADATREIITQEFAEVLLLSQSKNLGFAGGNNIGMHHAYTNGYDAVVLLNDDTTVRDTWLAEFVQAAKRYPDTGILQSKILFAKEAYRVDTIGNPLHPLGFSWAGGYKELSSQYQADIDIACASGAAMFIKRMVIEKIGYLDEQLFLYHEDVDYSWRARLAGFEIRLAGSSVVLHDHVFSIGGKKFYYSERNRLVVFFSQYRLWTTILLLPAFVLTEILILVYAAWSGWILWKLKSYVGVFLLWFHIVKKRTILQQVRRLSDKRIIHVMTTRLEFEGISNPGIRYVYNPLFQIYFFIIKHIIR